LSKVQEDNIGEGKCYPVLTLDTLTLVFC